MSSTETTTLLPKGNDTIQLNAGLHTHQQGTIAGGAAHYLSFAGGEVIGLDANGNKGADTFTINGLSMISSTVTAVRAMTSSPSLRQVVVLLTATPVPIASPALPPRLRFTATDGIQ